MIKRGQVTVFIIIAIIIVGAVAIFFSLRGGLISSGIPASIDSVYTSFLFCFEETSKEGIYHIASHGGYYRAPNESSITYFTEKIPYYYLNSRKYVPPLNLIERELGNYISENLEECFDLEYFKRQGFDIEIDYSILTKIEEDSVKIEMVHPMTIEKGDTSVQIKEKLNFDSNFKNLYDVSWLVVESYAENPGLACITCLEELAEKNKVIINSILGEVSFYNKNIIWFFITDEEDYSENKLTWGFVVEK